MEKSDVLFLWACVRRAIVSYSNGRIFEYESRVGRRNSYVNNLLSKASGEERRW